MRSEPRWSWLSKAHQSGLIIAAVAVACVSCSSKARLAEAETIVARFRLLQAAGEYITIYTEAADTLRLATPERDFVGLLAAVTRKLGALRSADRTSWNVNFQPWGAYITLHYYSKYANGEANERFVVRVKNGEARLFIYNIESNALVTR